ncbi:AraC family transcriptional regulator [Nordella sp. HKS 07]|uniref:helix-turn-helix domain-containing protein n=1 Tax=Nordella sp. HKS 07 TaxID=2712222 RepID=UPI0013E177C5|nr:helix-turn-helix transcriptional regulator [Nordella sp. HKS 07]QIG49124.1 AraC family transcriptional regulator [Nordella sp. HKS 07]
MSITIPFIRGFALFPTLSWFARRGIPVEEALHAVSLPRDMVAFPCRPVPLVQAAALLQTCARQIGPDLPYRIVSEADDLEIAMLGRVGLGTGTPREALARIIAALPFYCSHEHVSMRKTTSSTIVSEFFSHRFDPETTHLLLQYAATMIDRICGMTGAARSRFLKIELPAHPEFGLTHLTGCFGPDIVASRSRGLSILIDNQIMDRPFGSCARDRLNGRQLPDHNPLRGDGTLAASVRLLLVSMIEDGQAITIEPVVSAAGLSARSFQRQLKEEGRSFSKLLAETRRSETQKRLHETDVTIASIAAELGYADQASLTRAFRRWTGSAPRHFRVQRSP